MTKSPEVRAAVERVRHHEAEPSNRDTYHNTPFTLVGDWATLARDYLAENPPDEDEPITEEWLRSVGFDKIIHWPSIVSTEGEIFTYQNGSLWADEKRLVRVSTRGQMRSLCCGLMIQLEEPS